MSATEQAYTPTLADQLTALRTYCARYGTITEDAARRKPGNTEHNMKKSLIGRLPVREEITECEYHRPPTKAEINRGYGATHYRTFDVAECCHPGTRIKKRWFIAQDDGLRYYE